MGLPQDLNKSVDLWNRAAELGSTRALYNVAQAYYNGRGVGRDEKRAIGHYKLAAIGGHEFARHGLGMIEHNKGNVERAYKHYMIAAKDGDDESLKAVGEGYKLGYVTKDDYVATLRAYQRIRDEMTSEQRTEATLLQSKTQTGTTT